MAEEGLPGTAPSPVPVTPMTAPGEPQAPQTPAPQAPSPQGGGKTVEQLSTELEEQRQLVRDNDERMARLEHDNQLARQIYDNFTRDRVPPKEEIPDIPAPGDEEMLTNPGKATASYLDRKLEAHWARERQEREKERAGTYLSTAKASFEQGKTKAIQSNPALFRGITEQVSSGILESVNQGLKTGSPVDPSLLGGEQYWELSAIAQRISAGESLKSIMTKYYSTGISPMTPGHTETPTAGAPPQVSPVLNENDRAWAKYFGATEEQWAASKSKEGVK